MCALYTSNIWILKTIIHRYTRGEREHMSGTRTWVQMLVTPLPNYIGLLNHHHACLAIYRA